MRHFALLLIVCAAAVAVVVEFAPAASSTAPRQARFTVQTVSKGKPGEVPVGTRLQAHPHGFGRVTHYQWLRCNRAGRRCVAIRGATHRFYTVRKADLGRRLRVRIVQGNSSSTSAATGVVGRPLPVNTALPVITDTGPNGTLSAPFVDDVLAGSNGTWKYAKSFTYQWEDCDSTGANCVAISGATAQQYTLTDSDVGFTIRFVVTAYNY
jgi:hypothetical protein